MTTPPWPRRALAASISLTLPLTLGIAAAAGATQPAATIVTAAEAPAPTAGGFGFFTFPLPLCEGIGVNVTEEPYYSHDDCGFAEFTLSEAPAGRKVEARLFANGAAEPFATLPAVEDSSAPGTWQVDLKPGADWIAGNVLMRVVVGDQPAGEATFAHNLLGAALDAPASVKAGEAVAVTGTVTQLDNDGPTDTSDAGVPATFDLAATAPDGSVVWSATGLTAADDGTFSAEVPAAATTGLQAGPDEDFRTGLSLEVVRARYSDGEGNWRAARAGSTTVDVVSSPTTLLLENRFVSSVGWVKPGESYPSRLLVTNATDRAFQDVRVTVPAPDGATFTQARPGAGAADVTDGAVTWTLPTVAAATDAGPTVVTLVLESEADTLAQDPRLVWKDLSSHATLEVGGDVVRTSWSHGPKVVPPGETYETARFGDRPFPVVPVDYLDRKHQDTNSGHELSEKINSERLPGSTFNLFQEMSLGQLFPEGTVPSSNIATAGFPEGEEFPFTSPEPAGTCHGVTAPQAAGTPLYPERIRDGFYQLPGSTAYYGADKYGSAVPGAVAGVGALMDIDSACGPTGKLVLDAAAIADPEIDYSDYDTDKDGVVDFFMVVFAGCGGNGSSQLSVAGCAYPDAPYDNVWPHSSSLEFYYTDPGTGLPGFVTDDQLKDLEGRPLFYTDDTYSTMTTEPTPHKVFVRVGPYNVNPETAIDRASVISHEYGHSLGLPDFYSLGNRETYGDWNLMATDKSQHMDVYSRQEMGWVVPEVLEPGTTTVEGWKDSKEDTNTIHWQTPDGEPYTLQGPRVHNSQAYVAKLPGRQLIDPAKFDTGDKASATHAWWSGSGNDFGCAPEAGRNLDIAVPGLKDLPAGTTVKLSFKSLFDIEWDYDYGFVLTSTDGQSYTSQESENGTTTPATQNPNANGCQSKYGNGITGTSGSYQAGTEATDRVLGEYPESVFMADSFDISELAGQEKGVIRFSYATDPGLARPGWFVDDLEVVATLPSGEKTLLATDFESTGGPEDPHVFNGGCREDIGVASRCTKGWNYVDSSSESPADHAYYLEMRDRSGFDLDGRGENDRDPIAFGAGLSLVYTDEAHGYGNAGTDNPPAQSPLDSTPQPGEDAPDLSDAAFTAAAARSTFSDSGEGHTDNYTDPGQTTPDPRYPDEPNPWRFRYDCLTFKVLSMSGEGPGPQVADGDLTGDVRLDLGAGCGEFDYGYLPAGPPPNTAPQATAEATPNPVAQGKRVYLDASDSTDAESTPDELDFVWDFGDGGSTKDATGPIVRTTYDQVGTYTATVTVTDPQGATSTRSVEVQVVDAATVPESQPEPTPEPAPGPRKVGCEQSAVERDGSWRTRAAASARGDRACDNLGRGSGADVLTLRFTGGRLGLTYARARRGGVAEVVVDGTRVGKVRFGADRARPRFGYSRTFTGLGAGPHVVRLRVLKGAAYVDDLVVWGQVIR